MVEEPVNSGSSGLKERLAFSITQEDMVCADHDRPWSMRI